MKTIRKGTVAVAGLGLCAASWAGLNHARSVTLDGVHPVQQMGWALADAGDMNGDGRNDLAIGSWNFGLVYVTDDAGRVLHKWDRPGHFGRSLAAAGDLDGDGYGDLLVGGQVSEVLSGRDGSALLSFQSPTATDFYGRSCAAVGDLDGDGVGDLAVGSATVTLSDVGEVAFFSGTAGAHLGTLFGGTSDVDFGMAIAGVGDWDGGGRADVAVGNPEDAEVRIYAGETFQPIATLTGTAGSRFGCALAVLGDLTGDGRPELLVGAELAQSGGIRPGAAMVVRSSDGAAIRTLWGEADLDLFGGAVSRADDTDGDGAPDLLVGARRFGNDHGKTYLFGGAGLLKSWAGTQALAQAGHAVTGLAGTRRITYGAPWHDGPAGANAGRAVLTPAR